MQEASFPPHQHINLPFQDGHILLLRSLLFTSVTRHHAESEAHAVRVRRVVAVRVAVVVDIPEVRGRTGIR